MLHIYGVNNICSVYSENPSKFIEDILKVHNEYRAIHGSPPLRIDEKVGCRRFICRELLVQESTESAACADLARL